MSKADTVRAASNKEFDEALDKLCKSGVQREIAIAFYTRGKIDGIDISRAIAEDTWGQ